MSEQNERISANQAAGNPQDRQANAKKPFLKRYGAFFLLLAPCWYW